jgi:NADPH-dependent curcumin reductase CurA
MLIENHYVSLDPAMRGWINETRSYIKPVAIGEVMRAGTIGKVIDVKGKTPFKKGDFLSGWGGVQKYLISKGEGHYPINPKNDNLPIYIGSLGMPGMTAYFGILEEGKIKEGDVVLISGAAGAVGSLAGQIAKIKGCKVIGIVGGEKKANYIIDELGFDGAIDYKKDNVIKDIKRECPKGIDVYFDNVGGKILDSALIYLRMNARIVICGAISQYNNVKAEGPNNYLSLLVNRATMKGMIVFDYAHKYSEAMKEISNWIDQGKIKSKEDIYYGIENFYETFLRLFSGDKLGKLVLQIKK